MRTQARNMVRIAWDVALYGPNGREHARSEFYRWLCSIRVGRLALASVWFGVNCIAAGHLVMLGLWLRRREYRALAG